MISTEIAVFWSCSFSPADAAVNERIEGVCKGAHLSCVNVGADFSSVPPEKAR